MKIWPWRVSVWNTVANIESRVSQGWCVKIKQGSKSYSVLDLLPVNFNGNHAIRWRGIHTLVFWRIDDKR